MQGSLWATAGRLLDTLGALWDITQFRDPIGRVNVAEPPCLSTKNGLPEFRSGTPEHAPSIPGNAWQYPSIPGMPRSGVLLGASPTCAGGQDDVSSQAHFVKWKTRLNAMCFKRDTVHGKRSNCACKIEDATQMQYVLQGKRSAPRPNIATLLCKMQDTLNKYYLLFYSPPACLRVYCITIEALRISNYAT